MKIKGNYIKNRKMDLLSFAITYDAKRIFKLIPKMNRQLIITSLLNIIILRRKYGKQLFDKVYYGHGNLRHRSVLFKRYKEYHGYGNLTYPRTTHGEEERRVSRYLESAAKRVTMLCSIFSYSPRNKLKESDRQNNRHSRTFRNQEHLTLTGTYVNIRT
jgi:hypothetical protein